MGARPPHTHADTEAATAAQGLGSRLLQTPFTSAGNGRESMSDGAAADTGPRVVPPSVVIESDSECGGSSNGEIGHPPQPGPPCNTARGWDTINLEEQLRTKIPTCPYIPKAIRGPFLQIYGQTLRELVQAYENSRPDPAQIERRWKASILLPCLLLHPVRQTGAGRGAEYRRRIQLFRSGDVAALLRQANAGRASTRPGQASNHLTDDDKVWEEAAKLIEQGQLSRAAKLLNSAGLAPRNADTLAQLTDPAKRPPQLTVPLTSRVTQYSPARPIDFDGNLFVKNLRGARKGGAPGPNGCRAEHLKAHSREPRGHERSCQHRCQICCG